ncbi:lantibiotic dehydratase [Streptomyces sp. MMS24-I29]|uniref:lantibiotic dehydratase n=1 Tax=Streptomyces sp. MMS24-I29 TaxID=3351480 RepID=UPI003C7B21CC
MAGFPFELLGELASPCTTRAASRLVAARERIQHAIAQTHGDALLARARTKAEGAALRALRARRLPQLPLEEDASPAIRETVLRFAEALAEGGAAESDFASAYAEAERVASLRVFELFRQDPELRAVLLVSSEKSEPVLVRRLSETAREGWRYRNDDKFRYHVDTFVRHLQRVCAKNDTTSHLGPFALGRFDPETHGLQSRPAGLVRHPVLARWAAQDITDVLRRDPLVRLGSAPRRAAGAWLHEGVLKVVSFDYSNRLAGLDEAVRTQPGIRLTPFEADVYDACDGTRTLRDIAGLLEEDRPGADTAGTGSQLHETLRRLEEIGAVVTGPELPYGQADPLPWLLRLARTSSDPAVRDLVSCAADVQARFASGTHPQRRAALDKLKDEFTALTGRAPERGAGAFYGDRSLIHEDCRGRFVDLRLGAPLTDLLQEELPTAYDLMMEAPRRRRAAESAVLARWFAGRFGGKVEVPLHDYLTAFTQDAEGLEDAYRAVDADEVLLLHRFEQGLVPADARGAHEVRVDPLAVAELLTAQGRGSTDREPAMCNPDLMIAAVSEEAIRSGDFHLVVSEIHANEENLSHGIFGPFLDAEFPGFTDDVLDGYRRLLAPDEDLADVTLFHRNKSYIRTDLNCLEVEAYERSSKPRDRVLALADLQVTLNTTGLRLGRPGDRHLRLVALPFWWLSVRCNPFVPFGFPHHTGRRLLPAPDADHMPRITMGRVVLQREFWRVAPPELAAPSRQEAFLKVQALRSRLGLPRHVYARIPGETKPICCDLDSPLLVRQLTRFAARSNSALELSEMLPAPSHLWARDAQGRYTSELRYTAFSSSHKPEGAGTR